MGRRLNQERQNILEPKRIQEAIEDIENLGYKITLKTSTTIVFKFMDKDVTFYPYSGWHTGKTIKDGRGKHKLINQIKCT